MRSQASIVQTKIRKAQWFQENKDRIYARRKLNPTKTEQVRKYWLKYGYGITPDEFEAFYIVQKGKCWICEHDFDALSTTKKPLVDHNNKGVRGLLCFNCNVALGHFKENINTMKNAINYLGGSI